MTNKALSDLVVQVSALISEINNHPDYQEIEERGYESSASLGDAYQAMADLIVQVPEPSKKVSDA